MLKVALVFNYAMLMLFITLWSIRKSTDVWYSYPVLMGAPSAFAMLFLDMRVYFVGLLVVILFYQLLFAVAQRIDRTLEPDYFDHGTYVPLKAVLIIAFGLIWVTLGAYSKASMIAVLGTGEVMIACCSFALRYENVRVSGSKIAYFFPTIVTVPIHFSAVAFPAKYGDSAGDIASLSIIYILWQQIFLNVVARRRAV
jgi:hypothetical protein